MKRIILLVLVFSIHIGANSQELTWDGGAGDGLWSSAANWSNDAIPSSTDDVNIGNNTVTINNDEAVCKNLTIGISFFATGTLNVNSNSSLNLSGNLFVTPNSSLIMKSSSTEYSSLIVSGSSSGVIFYFRHVNDYQSGWDLVGSPVTGMSVSNFINFNTNSSVNSDGSLATDNANTIYSIGKFDNTVNPYNPDSSQWSYYAVDGTHTDNLDEGKGFSMASNSAGEQLLFYGSVSNSNSTVSIQNNNNNTDNGSRWNLISNPFPSYFNANSAADTNNNFLSDNLSKLDSNFQAIYGWNGTSYFSINNIPGSSGVSLAPGQGFFVAANGSSETINFNKSNLTISGYNNDDDDFINNRLAQYTYKDFFLRLYDEDGILSENRFFFDNDLTLGLDPGFDIGAFDQNMDIVSRIVENDQGIGFSVNAMGLSTLDEETVIPLVLNRDAGVEFSISFEDSTIPEDIGVYLEDTLLETLTDLRSEDFTLTPESDLSDMGRFYLRIGNTSLGGNDLDESYISIYKAASDDFVTIEGLSNVEKVNVQLFNIIGQEVLNTTLNSNQSTQRVSTSGLTTGVYVIRLQADSNVIAKKIIIN